MFLPYITVRVDFSSLTFGSSREQQIKEMVSLSHKLKMNTCTYPVYPPLSFTCTPTWVKQSWTL